MFCIKSLVFLLLFNFVTDLHFDKQHKNINNFELTDNKGKSDVHSSKHILQFIFCSDLHFGLTRKQFRNDSNVSAAVVNAAMVEKMKTIPNTILPNDGGVGAGEKVGGMNGLIITGDICNRQEPDVQSATKSWNQFGEDYLSKSQLLKALGKKTQIMLTPGNHDISNAIGFPRPMNPLTDNASMVGMYNIEMKPSGPKANKDFEFHKDKIHYSINMGGIHFMFVSAWPDSSERIWMREDLKLVPNEMPAFIFTHSDPNVEARFFKNPKGDRSINTNDKFENLVEESFKDGESVKDNTKIEQRGLVSFLQSHPNIKAYFHGHTNYAEFYDWHGPDSTINLPCFRVDSPMKGRLSAKDESKVSFNVITIDTDLKKMTVRECLWNTDPAVPTKSVAWGMERTISY